MNGFIKVPHEDITFFLSSYGQNIPDDTEESYIMAYDLLNINRDHDIQVPESIADWIISNKVKLNKKYLLSYILSASKNDLDELRTQLLLPDTNKERIIRILSYANMLDNDLSYFDMLPEEVIEKILLELDCKTIVLMCKFLNKQCRLYQLLSGSLSKYLDPKNKYSEDELLTICKSTSNIEKNKVGRLDISTYFIIGRNRSVYIADKKSYRTTSTSNVNKIFANDTDQSAFFLTDSGEVYVYGNNEYGQLGLVTTNNVLTNPLLLPDIKDIKMVSQTYYATYLLSNDGNVYVMGTVENQRVSLSKIDDISDIVSMSANKNSIVFLGNDGSVYGYGNNFYGVLILKDKFEGIHKILDGEDIKQIQLSEKYLYILTSGGKIYYAGGRTEGKKYKSNIKEVENIKNVKQITVGKFFAVALTYDGKLYTVSPKVHRIPIKEKVIDYSLDYRGVFILTDKLDLYAWGYFGYLYTDYIGLKKIGSSVSTQLLGLNIIKEREKIHMVQIDKLGVKTVLRYDI
jgi:hypothetical protein